MDEVFDIVIAGGGPVGAALALGLRRSGLKLALLESRAIGTDVDDGRTIALSHGSRMILERLGVWGTLAPELTPIHNIFVSQRESFGRTELRAAEAKVPALGYVASYAALRCTLATALESGGVSMLTGHSVVGINDDIDSAVAITDTHMRLTARLVVIADGGGGLKLVNVKTREYHQSAVVCNITSTQSHLNRAFERFTKEGALALLPTARGWSLVWTVGSEQASRLATLDDAEFCRLLQREFGGAVGVFSRPGPRRTFPLALKYATRPLVPRTVFIGNAAQTLHPVAGQGFNLGLRDAWELARTVDTHRGEDAGASELLKAYFSQRRFDRFSTIVFTDSLIRLFCKDIPPLNGARSLGLAALGAIPVAKNLLARRMMFGARG